MPLKQNHLVWSVWSLTLEKKCSWTIHWLQGVQACGLWVLWMQLWKSKLCCHLLFGKKRLWRGKPLHFFKKILLSWILFLTLLFGNSLITLPRIMDSNSCFSKIIDDEEWSYNSCAWLLLTYTEAERVYKHCYLKSSYIKP